MVLLLIALPLARATPTVTPVTETVIDADGHVAWKPGAGWARHANGQTAWSEYTGACLGPDGQPAERHPCRVDLGDGWTLALDREGGRTQATVEPPAVAGTR